MSDFSLEIKKRAATSVPKYTHYEDKILGRKEDKLFGVSVPRIYSIAINVDKLNWDNVSEKYVLKVNHWEENAHVRDI